MTWALIAWTVIMVIWIAVGASSTETDPECLSEAETNPFLTAQDCEAATDVGTGIGVVLLVALWFMGFVVLALVWFMSRPRSPR